MIAEPLTVVIVHWNQAQRCLRSLERLADQGVPVAPIVVDNGSTAEQLRTVRSGVGADVEIVELGHNAGFGPGANAGFRRWLADGAGEWVALMPHDALPAPGALAEMLGIARDRPRLGLLSADVGDGATPIVDPYFGGITRPARVERGFEAADHPHGTLMLARRDLLSTVGLFDERYFAYCEEADLGLRAAAAGWEVGLARGTMVENPSMGPGSPAADYLQLRNTLLLVREHSGRYHAGVRAGIALYQLAAGVVRPRHRYHLFSARARVMALRDAALSRYGPPPTSLYASDNDDSVVADQQESSR
ncbi:MAG: glycosyltransferase [Acidimicrobiales bacterium]